MATDEVLISGKGRWFNVEQLDKYGSWSVVLYFDVDSAAYKTAMELKKKGIRNELKKDEDGYFMRFKRPPFIDTKLRGKIPLAPPVVVEKDGKTAFRGAIGHGSDVTLKLEVYPFKGGSGGWACRLQGIRLDNLVPYEKKDFPPEQQEQVEGLDKAPAPLW